MVNKTADIKSRILAHLYKADGETLSGVHISNTLGISRVAVWKHITALKQDGFSIESRPKGYALKNAENLLLPFCFPKNLQDRIFHYTELESTMDEAKFLARNGAPHLSVVIAENQSTGRGRLNRKWHSSKGGLWFTIILKPDTPPVLSYIYNFAASVTLSETLSHLFDIDVFVKWPNDLLLEQKKLVGLLSETETRGDMVEFVNIGIGINVNNHPGKNEPGAISLKNVLNRTVSRKDILQAFLQAFEACITAIDPEYIIARWKKNTATIGSMVRVETLGDVFEGRAVDVDTTGALIIEAPNKEIQKIIYGDCFHT